MKVFPLAVGATTKAERSSSTMSRRSRCHLSGLKLTRFLGSLPVPTVLVMYRPMCMSWKACSSSPTPDQHRSTSLVTRNCDGSLSAAAAAEGSASLPSFFFFLSSLLSFLSSFLSSLPFFLSSLSLPPFFLSSLPSLPFSGAAAATASAASWAWPLDHLRNRDSAVFGKPMESKASCSSLMPLPSKSLPKELNASCTMQNR
mmetsp:Transcript_65897/g.192774  ORF Transcript_65897/g.192774 Transcript_65897/m.192774 type:complete len:201 (-) Transcript_65897:1986-2588(-)